MKRKDLKNLLAGMGIASLIGAGGLAVPSGSAAASSGWSGKTSAGGTEKAQKAAGSGWSGKAGSVVDAAKKNAEACMDKAIDTAATDQEAARAMARECLKDFLESGQGIDKIKKKGKSGWS